MDLMNEQLKLEERMASLGVERFHRQMNEAYQSKDATKGKPMRFILESVINPTATAIQRFIEEANTGKAGRRHVLVRYLKDIDPNTAAYLTAKTLLDNILHSPKLVQMAINTAMNVEMESRIDHFERKHPRLCATVLADLQKRTGHIEHRRKVINHVIKAQNEEWKHWTTAEQVAIGTKLIHLMLEATGLGEIITRSKGGKRRQYVVQMTERFRTWLLSIEGQLEVMMPIYLPCIVPPKDWTGMLDGGYHSDAFVYPPKFVKAQTRDHRKLLETADLSNMMCGVNMLQKTAWKIEPRTLEVINTMVASGQDYGVLPLLENVDLPPKPEDIDTNEEARLAWKRAARDVYTVNEVSTSKRVSLLKAKELATEYSKYDAIYFPYNLDFRGRVYPIPQILNPQGPDFVKSLLVFAEGGAIENKEQGDWLAVHGANTFGEDKISMPERINWVLSHTKEIKACAADPIENRWWTEADSPFCFLTWCFEWTDFLEQGWGFMSHIPIALDGTCNGIQHYSAILRDPVGGAAVNLLPSPQPQDIYGEVAKVVMDTLLKEVSNNNTNAAKWYVFSIDRTITKRPVMVLPYGGTISSCRSYVEEAVKKQIADGKENPFSVEEWRPAIDYLSSTVWSSIGEVVVAARVAMGWLQQTTALLSKGKKPVHWVTPEGFPVVMRYENTKTSIVDTNINGRVQLNISENVPLSLNARRQRSSIAPNFIHSMDAAALVRCLRLSEGTSMQSFAAIHDSFATHASNTAQFSVNIRKAFVQMYQDNDVLEQFRKENQHHIKAEITSPPGKGTLDLNEVNNSPFFFA